VPSASEARAAAASGPDREGAAAAGWAERAAESLGLVLAGSSVDYAPGYAPPAKLACRLIMVPHGQTPSNVGLLFQSHADGGPDQTLTESGVEMARRGAAAFAEDFGPELRAGPDRWAFYRSPLSRTAQTAAQYEATLAEAGIPVASPGVDARLIEIDAGSWHGFTVDGLAAAGRAEDAEAAAAYRGGSFLARPLDGSGESLLELIARAAEWLRELQGRHAAGDTVVVFGHGTFQNAVEVLLRCYPEKSPAQVFSRVSGGSHLRRGEAHLLVAGQ